VTTGTENTFAIPEIKVGDTAPNFVVALARMNPLLKSLSFTIYSPKPGVHERLARPARRSATNMLTEFLDHDRHSNKKWQILVGDLTGEMLKEKIASLPDHVALALDSRCTFRDESLKYIPMMDFKLHPNGDNLELLKRFLKRIACKGIIVDSGASYHFYGFDFLDYARWREFMGKWLLAPWSDSRWIGHSLIANGGDLRISATQYKQKLPSVSEIVVR